MGQLASNYFARSCLLLVILLLSLLGACAAQAAANQQSEEQYACDDVSSIPASQRCSFVKEHCESDSWVPYMQWYYCSVEPKGKIARVAFVVALLALLPLLFTLLGDTAELYFSPTMALVAQTIPGMRPRFAGVTFVAMGNGAPDLSANISALRTGQVALSAGAITGAAMFVQCVVASEVIRIAGGVKCRGAALRDIGVYAVSVLCVGLSLWSGKVTQWFVAGTIMVYVVYVAWVFLGDEWHARGRPELRANLTFNWSDLRELLLERQDARKHSHAAHEGRPVVHTTAMGADGQAAAAGDDNLTEALLPWAPLEEVPLQPANEESGLQTFGSPINLSTYEAPEVYMPPSGTSQTTVNGVDQPTGAHHQGALMPVDRNQASILDGVELPQAGAPSHPAGEIRQGSRPSQDGTKQLNITVGDHNAWDSGSHMGSHLDSGEQLHKRDVTNGWYSSPPLAIPGAARTHRASRDTTPRSQAPISRFRSQAASAPHHHSHLLNARTYRQAVWADLAWEPPSRARRQIAALAVSKRSTGHSELPEYSPVGYDTSSGASSMGMSDAAAQAAHQAQLQLPTPDGRPQQHIDMQHSYPRDDSGGSSRTYTSSTPMSIMSRITETINGPKLWHTICRELTIQASEEWESMPQWRQSIRTLTFSILLPLYAALRLTVPQVDPETYSQKWLVASMLCCPFAVLVYMGATSTWAVLTALTIGCALALVIHLLTKDELEMPALDCGTRFAFGPGIVSLVGFFMGVLWIDTLASEVVGVITLVSGLMKLPPSLVGLTLLTWGNSLGDFFGNQAMARRGASSTALTACFAAPLFNMLISMALGFSAYFAKEKVHSAPVSLPMDAALGVASLVLYNIVLATVGWLNNQFIPERFYLFARAWYGVYLVAAATLAMLTTNQ